MRLIWCGLCKPLLARLKQQIQGKGADSTEPVTFLSGLIIVIFSGMLGSKTVLDTHTEACSHAQTHSRKTDTRKIRSNHRQQQQTFIMYSMQHKKIKKAKQSQCNGSFTILLIAVARFHTSHTQISFSPCIIYQDLGISYSHLNGYLTCPYLGHDQRACEVSSSCQLQCANCHMSDSGKMSLDYRQIIYSFSVSPHLCYL